MKKLSVVFVGMFLFLLTGCLSPKIVNFNYKERAAQGTPENSVLFYGCYESITIMEWSQSDSEYPADYQKLEGPYVVSAPVAPGSRYRLQYVYGSYRVGNYVTYWSETYTMQNTAFDIKIPEEPGLYYFGTYSGANSHSTNSKVVSRGLFNASDEKLELNCLKEVLKKYKGTAWEPVIKERMEELK